MATRNSMQPEFQYNQKFCNQKFNAWHYMPPVWFEECDSKVSKYQSLYDSDIVESSYLQKWTIKTRIFLRRHVYTIPWSH